MNVPMYYNAITWNGNTNNMNTDGNNDNAFKCIWCVKQRQYSDGYYYKPSTNYCVCLQCAADQAEKQINKYESRCKINGVNENIVLKNMFLGTVPSSTANNNNDDVCHRFKTALCVFTSQRQASKCVYVRSRLAFEGVFATHYHHYSKIKKEIALSIKPKIKYMTTMKPSTLSPQSISSNNNNVNDNEKQKQDTITMDTNKKEENFNFEQNNEQKQNENNNNNNNNDVESSFLTQPPPPLQRLFSAPVYSNDGTPVVQIHQINKQ